MKESRSWNVEDLEEKYSMMRGNNISMQVLEDGDPIEIEGWLLYEDMDADSGECKTLLAIRSQGKNYTTISKTFIREFLEAWDFFADAGETLKRIAVVHGTSKAGRVYVSCQVR